MSCLAENLKFLLWKSKGRFSRKSYAEHIVAVASECKMAPERFRAVLLDKAGVTAGELSALRTFFEMYGGDMSAIEDAFLFSDEVSRSGKEILKENLEYLFGTLEYGDNPGFLEKVGVNVSTLTRWKRGGMKPGKYSLARIVSFFGLEDVKDLETGYLFLDLEPASTWQKKQLCRKMIGEMDNEAFERIYEKLRTVLTTGRKE